MSSQTKNAKRLREARLRDPKRFKTHDQNSHTLRKIRRADYKSILELLKLSVGCKDCGFRGHPEALDFDHRRDKSFNIGQKRCDSSFADLMNEAAKCDVVCANCHRIRTASRREETV